MVHHSRAFRPNDGEQMRESTSCTPCKICTGEERAETTALAPRSQPGAHSTTKPPSPTFGEVIELAANHVQSQRNPCSWFPRNSKSFKWTIDFPGPRFKGQERHKVHNVSTSKMFLFTAHPTNMAPTRYKHKFTMIKPFAATPNAIAAIYFNSSSCTTEYQSLKFTICS
ncbi:hypothetical protein M758_1G224400 [Ceratodon purpureus]|nr:hypothetical protein M758_1G224400 [Ceratodon purpureus]